MSRVSDAKKKDNTKKELKELKEFFKQITPILDILEQNPILVEAILRGDMTDLDVIEKAEKIKNK